MIWKIWIENVGIVYDILCILSGKAKLHNFVIFREK